MVWDASLTAQIVALSTVMGAVSKAAVYFHSAWTHHKIEQMDEDEIDDISKDDPIAADERFKTLRSLIRQEFEARSEANLRHLDDSTVLVQVIFCLVKEFGVGRNKKDLRQHVFKVLNGYHCPSIELIEGLLGTYFDSDDSSDCEQN